MTQRGKHYQNFEELKNEVLNTHPDVRDAYDLMRARRRAVERIKELRVKHGITQSELATRMGVGQGVVSRLEGGDHSPRLETLQKAGDAMGYQMDVNFKKRRRQSVA